MDSEMAAFESPCVPCSSFKGRLQAQECGDLNQGENYGENFCRSAGKKKRLTVDQVQLLERSFNVGNKLEHETKVRLAKEMGLQPRQVAIWFQNRRARSKTKKMENDFDSLNSEYDNLKKDYDDLVTENQRLKAEVDELRDKWVANDKMKNPFEPVEAVDSSEFGKSNTNTMAGNLSNTQMGSFRQEEGSGSSSKSDGFYSESPAMENQLQSHFLPDEEDEFSNWSKLEHGSSVDELMHSYNMVTPVFEDQPFYFWPC